MKRRLILSSILFYSILLYSCSNSSSIVPVPVPVSTPTPTSDPTLTPATDETASGGVLLSIKNLALKVDQTENNGIVTFTPTVERFDEIYGEEGDEAPYIEYTWKIDGALVPNQNIAGANVDSESGVLTIDTSKFEKDTYQISCLAKILVTLKVVDEESTLNLAIFSWQNSLKVN
ncbi:MAG: hypothetical protein II814_11575 [Treponema sp.]|nr:hypothetical protein [Treponema sp.]